MDGSRFDDLARALGRASSRRRLLRGIAGGLTGLMAGGALTRHDASARSLTICHATGDPNAPWTSLVIDQSEFNLHARHGDYVRVECCSNGDCASLDGVCATGVCQNGYCVQLPTAAGTACDDQFTCTAGSVCDGAFSCGGGSTISCEETENPCTTAVCSESAQGCVEVPLDDGSTCGSSDACADYTCLSGICHAHSKTSCVGSCADCSGTCVDLNADLDNCGSCGYECPDMGKCLTTTCQSPGICLNTPVACPNGDQCNTAACHPETGCYLDPKTGESCEMDSGGPGTCGADGQCHSICTSPRQCESAADCGVQQDCLNGTCFNICSGAGSCSTGCAECHCSNTAGHGLACARSDRNTGICSNDTDCPAGSYCNLSFGSGNPNKMYLCTEPCPQLVTPV